MADADKMKADIYPYHKSSSVPAYFLRVMENFRILLQILSKADQRFLSFMATLM